MVYGVVRWGKRLAGVGAVSTGVVRGKGQHAERSRRGVKCLLSARYLSNGKAAISTNTQLSGTRLKTGANGP